MAEFSVILGHFMPRDPPNNQKNQSFEKIKKTPKILSSYTCMPLMMIIWCMVPEYGVRQTEFFVIMGRFLPFYPPMDPQNQNFEKIKKKLEDIIILQMFTINDSHMIYGFSDMECNRQNFLPFWTIFCPFTPLTTKKSKFFKNWNRTTLEIS